MAALQSTSRYGMPWMEGPFNEDPNLDESLDPVGQYSAVHCLLRVFRGVSIEDEKLVEKVVNGELEKFTVQEIAIFSTVVRSAGTPGNFYIDAPPRPARRTIL